MRNEVTQLMVSKWREPTDCRPVARDFLERNGSMFPPCALDYWGSEGLCQYKDGFYFTVKPDDWQLVVDAWVEGTPFEKFGRSYAFSRTAFGKITAFNPIVGAFYIHTDSPRILASGTSGRKSGRDLDISMEVAMTSSRPDREDAFDEDDVGLFTRARKKMGPLGWDEMFAYQPPLFAGGRNCLEGLVKVKWDPQLFILRDMHGPAVAPEMDLSKIFPGLDLDAIVARSVKEHRGKK